LDVPHELPAREDDQKVRRHSDGDLLDRAQWSRARLVGEQVVRQVQARRDHGREGFVERHLWAGGFVCLLCRGERRGMEVW
jgi:hypothetical protein